MNDEDRLAQAIQNSDLSRLDPARRARIRRRLLLAPTPEPERMGVHRPWRRVALAAVVLLAISLALGGAASASLPGDAAFPLKIEVERLQLLFSPDLYDRLGGTLRHADRRLDELALLARRDATRLPVAADAYNRTLVDVRAAIDAMAASEHANRARAFEEARGDLDRHISKLSQVHDMDGDIERALEKAREVEQRVKEAEAEGDREDDRRLPTPNPAQGPSRTSAPSAGSGGPGPGGGRTQTTNPRPTPTPDATRTAEPTETAAPLRTAEPTRTPDPARTPEPPKSPERTRTPSPSPSRR